MSETAAQLWNRHLTNALGGNFSVRTGDGTLLITPTRMSEDRHCWIEPEELLLIDYAANILEGKGGLSRETDMHIALMRTFPQVGAVIHAHPQNGMVFAAYEKPIPSVTEATEAQSVVVPAALGEHKTPAARYSADLVDFAPTCTPALADAVLRYFEAHWSLVESGAFAGVMRRHGLVVTGPSLNATFAHLEMVETDAYCALHRAGL